VNLADTEEAVELKTCCETEDELALLGFPSIPNVGQSARLADNDRNYQDAEKRANGCDVSGQ